MRIKRRDFYSPHEIVRQTEQKIEQSRKKGSLLDFITFVSDGEPTLDKNLGTEVELLQKLGYPIAIISNSSRAVQF